MDSVVCNKIEYNKVRWYLTKKPNFLYKMWYFYHFECVYKSSFWYTRIFLVFRMWLLQLSPNKVNNNESQRSVYGANCRQFYVRTPTLFIMTPEMPKTSDAPISWLRLTGALYKICFVILRTEFNGLVFDRYFSLLRFVRLCTELVVYINIFWDCVISIPLQWSGMGSVRSYLWHYC